MYDSYADYYGFNDVTEVKEIKMVGDFTPENCKVNQRVNRMSRDEYAEFVIAKDKFMNTLKKEIQRYDNIIAALDKDDYIIADAYEYKKQKVVQIAEASIENFEDLELYKWMYNGGNVRSKQAETEARKSIAYEKQYQADMEYRATGDFKLQKFFFVVIALIAIWILPGVLFPSGSGTFGIVLTNLIILMLFHPIQLLLSALAVSSDGFEKLETKPDGRMTAKGAATAAGVSAAMQARNMSKMGKNLMSGGKKI